MTHPEIANRTYDEWVAEFRRAGLVRADAAYAEAAPVAVVGVVYRVFEVK